MTLRSLIAAGALAAALAVPAAPAAAQMSQTGFAAATVNLRGGPGVKYARITVVPAGARLTIFSCLSWCHVRYAGIIGWVSAKYVAVARAPTSRFFVRPLPPPPTWGYYQRPWWDYQYGAWYDGRRWWWDNRWYNRPPGFSLWFQFGG